MPNFEVTLKFGFQGEERTVEATVDNSLAHDFEIKKAALAVVNQQEPEFVNKFHPDAVRVRFYKRI